MRQGNLSSRKRLKDVSIERISEMRSLHTQGLSLRQIGAKVGLSHGSVGRILKSQQAGQNPRPSKPSIPRRPRKGQEALPDFQRVSDFEARGLTVKDAWRHYAKGCAKPYVYTHFSTLYRKSGLKTRLRAKPIARGHQVPSRYPTSRITPPMKTISRRNIGGGNAIPEPRSTRSQATIAP